MHFTGTIVRNHVDLSDAIWSPFSLADDESIQYWHGRLMGIAWRAKSKKTTVILISSADSAEMTDVRTQRGEEVKKLLAVDRYNHQALKWWRKLDRKSVV